jgi:DNA cross-link repair 1A protein
MIAFRPTGWTFRSSSDPQQPKNLRSLESITRARTPDLTAAALKPTYESPYITIYGVPYSEHSSYRELALFIGSLDIHRIVPTVNVYNEKSRVKMSTLFEKWGQDKKKLIANSENGLLSVIYYPSENHW